jgi:hypothetical protein
VSAARFVLPARLEFLAEIIYYGKARTGLGRRFAAAVEEATARALAFPASGSPSRAQTRSLVIKDFPFPLIYREVDDRIVVFAVANHARRPYYWQSRIDPDV